MIELTQEQLQALDAPPQPPVAVDPRTGQEYLLIRREIYEPVRGNLQFDGRGRDDSADSGEEAALAPNLALLHAMTIIETIQKDMHPKRGKGAEEYVREARSGAMYGCDPTE